MGKSEILMLLAGVALSIMLAMIAIPIFSGGQKIVVKQKVNADLIAFKNAIEIYKKAGNDIHATDVKTIIESYTEDIKYVPELGSYFSYNYQPVVEEDYEPQGYEVNIYKEGSKDFISINLTTHDEVLDYYEDDQRKVCTKSIAHGEGINCEIYID